MTGATCEVLPGSGSVARRADSLVWASEQVSDLVWETLLACLTLGDRVHGAAPLLHAIAETMPVDLDADAAFAVVVTDGTAGFVLRLGRVVVTLDGQPVQGGAVVAVRVAGRTVVAGDSNAEEQLAAGSGTSRHDLRDGAVAGGGFRWSSSPTATPPSEERPATGSEAAPVPAAPEEPPDRADDAVELTKHDLPATDAHAAPTSDPEQTEFHPPPQRDAPSNPELARSVGVLVFEDGATANLTGDVVLGRRPEKHELVESGQAQPLVIQDPEHVLSSAHAAVRIQGDEVLVVDLDSLNGTHVASPEARDWTKLTAGAPYPMQDGFRMLLGWTVLTYRKNGA